ncbi:hypothetical protein ACFSF0_16045 [Ottowia flava]|uniref:Nucleotidyltransferase domain-containing protein n=1 Tax=Ottowia flava TaxID=2675430 RepID=A0ABW4L0R2_9BURK|nr:hypothetical protein [Ottowia sp. GY511]
MTREELEHIIRASGDITDQYEFVIVGSQSILGAVPRPEDVFTVSMEADIYPLQAPELADRIDGATCPLNLPRRFTPSLVQRELVDGGLFGCKSGRGFFTPIPPASQP